MFSAPRSLDVATRPTQETHMLKRELQQPPAKDLHTVKRSMRKDTKQRSRKRNKERSAVRWGRTTLTRGKGRWGRTPRCSTGRKSNNDSNAANAAKATSQHAGGAIWRSMPKCAMAANEPATVTSGTRLFSAPSC